MDDATELWLPIPDWEGLYEASSQGRIRSLPRETLHGVRGGNIMRPRPNRKKYGYLRLTLCGNGRREYAYVHDLVAAAFVGPKPPGEEVRHDDGDRNNNAAYNLMYGTKDQNEQDKLRHGTHTNANKTHCPQGHPYDEDNTYINPRGERICRACRRVSQRNWAAARRAA